MAIEAGVSMTEACLRAGVSPAVFHNWKAGRSSPVLNKLEAIHEVLRLLIIEQELRHRLLHDKSSK